MTGKRTLITTSIAFALGAWTHGAYAQGTQQAQQQQQQQQQTQRTGEQGQAAQIISLEQWNDRQMYKGGFSADELIGATVRGQNGDEIGEIENLIIDSDGKIAAVIAEVGGFWDIGDTHVAVPFNKVTFKAKDDIRLPVTKDNVDQYGLFESQYITEVKRVRTVADDVQTGPRMWKATELLDDYATLKNGVGYGYVSDLVFSKQGQLQAVIVSSDVRTDGVYGAYAYPYYGYRYGWNPGLDYYELPYARTDVAGLDPFDYDLLAGYW